MFVKITSKRRVTFPARVLDALGVKPGDRLELQECPEGFTLRAVGIDQSTGRRQSSVLDRVPNTSSVQFGMDQ